MADDIFYTGVDFSPVMVEEVILLNKKFVDKSRVNSLQASIERLPFRNDSFDLIPTPNTLYFWPNPKENIQELKNLLKPGGNLLIAYRLRGFIEKIELS